MWDPVEKISVDRRSAIGHLSTVADRRSTRVQLGHVFSEGAFRLWAVVRRDDLSKSSMDRALEATASTALRILYGDRRPTVAQRIRIAELWGIDPDAWERPARDAWTHPLADTIRRLSPEVRRSTIGDPFGRRAA